MFFYKRLNKAYNKEIDGTGLAVFRIAYCLVLLAELIQLFYFRHLIFDKIPYIEAGSIDPTIPMIVWMCSVLFILFGAFTRLATIVNYIFSLIFIGTITSYEYHMFYAYMGINFLLIFLPVSRCCSLDRLREKLKYSNAHFQYTPPATVSVFAYYLPLLVGVGFVYFDSILFKFSSPLWLGGLGMWLPASLPMLTHANTSFLMNQEWIVKFLGYLTVAFETVFIATFWYKRFRVPLLIIGLGLHIGILIEFPIPWFALGVSAIYLLMVPVSCWKRFRSRKTTQPLLKFYYDAECPLCVRTKIVIQHFDAFGRVAFLSVQENASKEKALEHISQEELFRNIHGVNARGQLFKGIDTYIQVANSIWYLKPLSWAMRLPGIYHIGNRLYRYVAENRTVERCTEATCGILKRAVPLPEEKRMIFHNLSLQQLKIIGCTLGLWILILAQLNVSYNSALVLRLRNAINLESSTPGMAIAKVSGGLKVISGQLFGITSHPVFMDFHFRNYNHIVAVVYKGNDGRRQFLPMIDENGMPGPYIYGFNWVKWTFRVDAPDIDSVRLAEGIRDFTAFWAKKHGVNLANADFDILVKKIDTPHGWSYDFLNQQISHPWIKAGSVKWESKQFKADIGDIESI